MDYDLLIDVDVESCGRLRFVWDDSVCLWIPWLSWLMYVEVLVVNFN